MIINKNMQRMIMVMVVVGVSGWWWLEDSEDVKEAEIEVD